MSTKTNNRAFHILLVEDNSGDARLIRELLSGADSSFDIEVAQTLSDGLDALASGSFDMILLDLILPDSSGLETFIRLQAAAPYMPIVIMTHLDDEELGVHAVRKGAQDYLVKDHISGDVLSRALCYAMERKHAEEKIKSLQSFHLSILDGIKTGVWVTDAHDIIRYANKGMGTIAGIPARKITGSQVLENFPDNTVKDFRPCYLKAKETLESLYYEAIPVKTPVGRQSYLSGWLIPRIKNGEFDGMICTVEDVTERRHLQERLIRSEQLAAAGQLAAYVAHEINSPLQAITTLLGMMKNDYSHDEELMENVDILKGAFGSIRDTVRNLLDLNRPGKDVRQLTDINCIIENTVALVRSHLKRNKIRISLELSSEIPDIIASPRQLSRMFLNLINNAVDAVALMSESQESRTNRISAGGEIRIRTCLAEKDIVISVSDTGLGISEKDLPNIFDPFYTTKKRKGTGVGLSDCRRVAEDHDGMITAENLPGGGAMFTIRLPLTRDTGT
ncbi:ATP-binding protein [Desulfobacterales bacterium HSG2]|nr:ATP-binding protein [Desulfobacterales bacterium HSG2]